MLNFLLADPSDAPVLAEIQKRSAKRWSLDTPSWAIRNHHFYKKMGFVQTGVIGDPDSQDAFFEYERISSDVTA